MNARTPKQERVGIRELRQNLSVYVKRVREEGRAYEVTERGEPVARLIRRRLTAELWFQPSWPYDRPALFELSQGQLVWRSASDQAAMTRGPCRQPPPVPLRR